MDETKKVIKVAATYIGTVIGAGFASGQEILRFFTLFGIRGIWGLVFCTVLFAFMGVLLLFLGQRLKAVSYRDVIQFACGKKIGPVMDLLLTFFLFGTLSVMLAGAGAVFTEQLGLPAAAGTVITLLLSVITVIFGLSGIVRANVIVVPVMITLGLMVSLPEARPDKVLAVLDNFSPVTRTAAPNWLLAAGLYLAFNLALSVPVLAPLGSKIRSGRVLICGGLLGGTVLGALALVMNFALLAAYPASADFQVPMLLVAEKSSPGLLTGYIFVLWAEIFTTIIGSIYGLGARLAELTGFSYRQTVLPVMAGALILSQAGFARLVTYLYPLFGYIAIVLILCLIRSSFFKTR
jgi:uncharacterized membrane protein YkvI